MQEIIAFIKSRQPVNLLIIAVNVAVYIVLNLMGDTEDAVFMALHGASVAPFIVEGQEYYRLITCMFLHFGADHIFYNMLALIFLGDTLEKMLGKVRYLIVYMLGGIAGNIVSVMFEMKNESYAVSAGASGAIFAVMGALVCAVIINKGKLLDYSGSRLVMMAALSIAQGLTAEHTDYWAHIGGFAGGFLIALLFTKKLRASVQMNGGSNSGVQSQ